MIFLFFFLFFLIVFCSVYDIHIPKHPQGPIIPHTIVTLPNSNGMQLLLCYDNEGVYVNTYGKVSVPASTYNFEFFEKHTRTSTIYKGVQHPQLQNLLITVNFNYIVVII